MPNNEQNKTDTTSPSTFFQPLTADSLAELDNLHAYIESMFKDWHSESNNTPKDTFYTNHYRTHLIDLYPTYLDRINQYAFDKNTPDIPAEHTFWIAEKYFRQLLTKLNDTDLEQFKISVEECKKFFQGNTVAMQYYPSKELTLRFKLFPACILLAIKLDRDLYYSNKHMASVFMLELETLNKLELFVLGKFGLIRENNDSISDTTSDSEYEAEELAQSSFFFSENGFGSLNNIISEQVKFYQFRDKILDKLDGYKPKGPVGFFKTHFTRTHLKPSAQKESFFEHWRSKVAASKKIKELCEELDTMDHELNQLTSNGSLAQIVSEALAIAKEQEQQHNKTTAISESGEACWLAGLISPGPNETSSSTPSASPQNKTPRRCS